MAVDARVGSTQEVRKRNFHRIALTNLQHDTIPDFDLFILTGKNAQPILYRTRGVPIEPYMLDRLMQHDVQGIFVEAKDTTAYYHYVEKNLRNLLSDENMSLPEKSEAMYGTAVNLMKEAFGDPRAHNVIERSENLVQTTLDCLMNDQTVLRELLKVASFDYYTYTHSVNVFTFSVALAKRLNLCEGPQLTEFAMGALLHDIGKYKIPPTILNARGKLSAAEWEIMRRHPLFGHEVLRDCGMRSILSLDIVRHHHEKLSGSGYPDGLKADEIRPLVRVCTICDVFDALTTKRPYKSAVQSFPALKIMKEEMAGEIDSHYFAEFVAMMGSA